MMCGVWGVFRFFGGLDASLPPKALRPSRQLCAMPLHFAALVPHRPAFFLDEALPFLLPLCTDGVLEARHGAVAAVAELLPALRWAACVCVG